MNYKTKAVQEDWKPAAPWAIEAGFNAWNGGALNPEWFTEEKDHA